MAKRKVNRSYQAKFKEEFCEELLEHMASGLSYSSFAGVIGVHRGTLYDWEKVYPEWADAKEVAFGKCLLFWEQMGLTGLSAEKFNSSVWIFNMKNRFQWRDRLPDEVPSIVQNNKQTIDNIRAEEKTVESLNQELKEAYGNTRTK